MIDRLNPINSTSSLVALSAAAAATYTSDDQLNENSKGVRVFFDVTTATAASVVLTIQAKDPVSGKYVDLLSSAAVTSTGTTAYTVYPGVTVASNVALSAPLGRTWRVKVVVSDNAGTAAVTGTVGATLCA